MAFPRLLFAFSIFALFANAASIYGDYCSTQNTGASFSPNFDTFQSHGACTKLCTSDKYAFAVVQDSNCWCSNYIPSEQGDVSDCTDPCPGYSLENCGNKGKKLFAYIQIGNASGTQTATTSSTTTTSSSSTKTSSSPTTSSQPTTTVITPISVTSTVISLGLSTRSVTSVLTSVISPSTALLQTQSSSTSHSSQDVKTSTTSSSSSSSSSRSSTSSSQTGSTNTSDPTSVPSDNGASSSKTSSGISGGAIAGIVIGVIALLISVGLAIFLILRRKRTATSDLNPEATGGAGNDQPPNGASSLHNSHQSQISNGGFVPSNMLDPRMMAQMYLDNVRTGAGDVPFSDATDYTPKLGGPGKLVVKNPDSE